MSRAWLRHPARPSHETARVISAPRLRCELCLWRSQSKNFTRRTCGCSNRPFHRRNRRESTMNLNRLIRLSRSQYPINDLDDVRALFAGDAMWPVLANRIRQLAHAAAPLVADEGIAR